MYPYAKLREVDPSVGWRKVTATHLRRRIGQQANYIVLVEDGPRRLNKDR